MIKVACCGTFDYKIHDGHLSFLNWASSLGDHLCVFIVSDSVVIRNKNRCPIYDQRYRALNILHTSMVDKVILLSSSNIVKSINEVIQYKPDIYAFGRDQHTKFDDNIEVELRKNNILLARSQQSCLISTTEILRYEGLLFNNES